MNRWELLSIAGMFVTLFVPIAIALVSGERWKAAQEKARERRLAEHRMNARLLRFDI
jgi:hypothetical protein